MDLFDIVAARVGGGSGGGTPQKQSDWAQSDSSKKDYIKNRPFYEDEVIMPYTETSFSITFNSGDGDSYIHDRLYLIAGETYVVTGEIPGVTTMTTEAVAYTLPSSETGFEKDVVGMDVEGYISIIDEVTFGASFSDITINEDTSMVIPEEIVLYNCNIYIEGKFGGTILKKIDKKFLPIDVDNIATKLPIASYHVLGGVMPNSKSSLDTQEVTIDEDGRLWTRPDTDTFMQVEQTTFSEYRHPVRRKNNTDLYAELYYATTALTGGVKITDTITSEDSRCPTSKAVYDYVANQINAIYFDLEGDAY